MKRFIILLIAAQLHTYLDALALKGIIKPSEELETVPPHLCYYQGREYRSDADGFITIPLDMYPTTQPGLLIGHDRYKIDAKNTPCAQHVNTHKPYLYYEQRNGKWVRCDLVNGIIPKETITLTLNPKLVESVSDWNIDLPQDVIKLPQIVLTKKSIERNPSSRKHETLLDKSSHKSEITAGIENRVFNEKAPETIEHHRKQNSVTIHMIHPQ